MANEQLFGIGDDVMPVGGTRGLVVDYRELPTGRFAVGVMTTNGRIDYYDERAIKSAKGMGGYPMKLT